MNLVLLLAAVSATLAVILWATAWRALHSPHGELTFFGALFTGSAALVLAVVLLVIGVVLALTGAHS